MFKYSFLLLSLYLFIACESNKTTILSGKIVKPTSNEIQLLKDEILVDKIIINENGTFKSLINIDKNGLFNFFHPPEFQYLIINKGDSYSGQVYLSEEGDSAAKKVLLNCQWRAV